mmetsp:Transcript_12077/g.10676  ORF Transcript_12077/g.10676 Transcript_12077/m.10676 type:complete len:321 (+) Transcript_12077:8-970(+)
MAPEKKENLAPAKSNYPFSCLIKGLNKFSDYVTYNLGPGPQFIPMNWCINMLKGLCGIYIFIIMLCYDNFSRGAWIYLTVHGSYGICWLLKDLIFPDSKYSVNITLLSSTLPISVMYIYLIPGYRMLSLHSGNNPSTERIIICFTSYLVGIFLMICSDLQIYYTTKYKPGLITTGFFKFTRNPNYIGEVLIYNSFAIIVGREEFWIILFFAYTIIFGIRMLIKDFSLSRKKGWTQYDSYMFLPKFSSCCLDNAIIYTTLFGLIYSVYICGGTASFLHEANKIVFQYDSSSFCDKLHQSELYQYAAILKDEVVQLITSYLK